MFLQKKNEEVVKFEDKKFDIHQKDPNRHTLYCSYTLCIHTHCVTLFQPVLASAVMNRIYYRKYGNTNPRTKYHIILPLRHPPSTTYGLCLCSPTP